MKEKWKGKREKNDGKWKEDVKIRISVENEAEIINKANKDVKGRRNKRSTIWMKNGGKKR